MSERIHVKVWDSKRKRQVSEFQAETLEDAVTEFLRWTVKKHPEVVRRLLKDKKVGQKLWRITDHPCYGCDYAIYSEEGFIDACDRDPDEPCPRGYAFKEAPEG